MGFVRQFSIGKRVWLDMNGNGVFESGEDKGIANVVLKVMRKKSF